MLIYPASVAAISLVFAGMVFQQYRKRQGLHQLTWAFALFLSFVASAAYLLAAWLDVTAFFRLYYITGGLMMAAYLGLGSLYLAVPVRVAHVATGVVTAGSLAGALLIMQAPLDPAAMRAALAAVEAGGEALAAGTWVIFTRTLNFIGAAAVMGVALHSAWQLYRRRTNAAMLSGNLLIALGVFLSALAGITARLGGEGFWLLMALGVAVLFSGFLVVERGVRALREHRAAG